MGHASSLFHSDRDQTLHSRITPTEEQRAFLQQNWNALADHLKSALQESTGYPISTWIQGSYKFGTLIKPVRKGEEYDVDLGVYFEWADDGEGSPGAETLRNWVQQELEDYEAGKEEILELVEPPLERCSRLRFTRQFHIDTPVYHLEVNAETRRLACLSGDWENSDPKKLYTWFRDAVDEIARPQIRRLIRYFKAWSAIAFQEDPRARPSSVLLTVLSTEAYVTAFGQGGSNLPDDECLAVLVREVQRRVSANSEVLNPIDQTEDLNRIEKDAWHRFLASVSHFADDAERALGAEDEAGAALIWGEIFSYLMPLPEAEEIEIVEDGSGRALMVLPEIEIKVFSRHPRQLRGQYRNGVTSVPKECDLVFRIINPEIIPDYATVEWTVRNEGQEADSIGDLGHRRAGIGVMQVEENTSYHGRHFMDCVVHHQGTVLALRRVPVNVVDRKYPERNPPRPPYVKLKSKLARRRRN